MLEEAGMLSVVIECVPAALGERITEALTAPAIGIGGGPHCSGQSDRKGLRSRCLALLKSMA